jgi:hypothetical protein
MSGFGFINGLGENRVCAGRSTRRVLPWYVGGSEYLESTTDDLRWSCLIGHQFYLTKEFPFPRAFQINVL